jgi:catechol 2,3-dioxygenase-like lactoylglutathione lyase family enzyme
MTFGASERSGSIVGGLHHVGHLVGDIEEAAAHYRRLGFVVPAPAFPLLPASSGQPAPVLSVGNAHIQFAANFVELATVVPDIADKPPAGAEMVLLRVPDAAVPRIRQELGSAATRLANALSRFEGVHILVFEAADVDAATQMLSASGVVCGAVNRIRRPVGRARGTEEVSIGYAEIEKRSKVSRRQASDRRTATRRRRSYPSERRDRARRSPALRTLGSATPSMWSVTSATCGNPDEPMITATCFSCRGTRCALSAIAMSPRCFRESNPSAHTKAGISTSCQPSSAIRCPCETSPQPASC